MHLGIQYAKAHVPFRWNCDENRVTFRDLINEMKKEKQETKDFRNLMDIQDIPLEEFANEFDFFGPGCVPAKRIDDWTLDTKLKDVGYGDEEHARILIMPRWMPDRPKHLGEGEERKPVRYLYV